MCIDNNWRERCRIFMEIQRENKRDADQYRFSKDKRVILPYDCDSGDGT